MSSATTEQEDCVGTRLRLLGYFTTVRHVCVGRLEVDARGIAGLLEVPSQCLYVQRVWHSAVPSRNGNAYFGTVTYPVLPRTGSEVWAGLGSAGIWVLACRAALTGALPGIGRASVAGLFNLPRFHVTRLGCM